MQDISRRQFIATSAVAGATASLPIARAAVAKTQALPGDMSFIHLFLPGGWPCNDLWDPKPYSPYRKGMRGSELTSTTPSIPTSAPDILLSGLLPRTAGRMHCGLIARSLVDPDNELNHGTAQRRMIDALTFGSPVKEITLIDTPPPRDMDVTRPTHPWHSAWQKCRAGFSERDAELFRRVVTGGSPSDLAAEQGITVSHLSVVVSRIKRAFRTAMTEAFGQTLTRENVMIAALGESFHQHVLVTEPYCAFQNFDAHENGATQCEGFARTMDRIISTALSCLETTGMLDRTILCISSEFNRTIAGHPLPGSDLNTGENLIINDERDYGFHAHFAEANSIVLFGGPFKRGFVYGKTGPKHPMRVVENPVTLADIHATIAVALGVQPREGRVIEDLFA